MMHCKVEPSGCSEYKGLVQVRYCLYLDPGDHGYERHLIEGVCNPFHNHFCQFEPTATDAEILFVGELALQMAKEKWDKGEFPEVPNQPIRLDLSAEKRNAAQARVDSVKDKLCQA
jgi:hypothetical protein